MIIALLFLILFALLFPGTLRFLFVLVLLGAIMVLGGAHAKPSNNSCNQRSIIADGFFTHGSMVCNSVWLDRPASIAMVELAAQCDNLPEASFTALATQGGIDFDRLVAKLGHKGACARLDKEMMEIDNAR